MDNEEKPPIYQKALDAYLRGELHPLPRKPVLRPESDYETGINPTCSECLRGRHENCDALAEVGIRTVQCQCWIEDHEHIRNGRKRSDVSKPRDYIFRATWSEEDGEYVATVEGFPSLSWLAPTVEDALSGLCGVLADINDE